MGRETLTSERVLVTIILRVFVAAALFSASGCAPGLGTTFDVSTVETVSVSSGRALTGVRVKYETFTDDRTDKTAAVIDGRRIEPEQDTAAAAQRIVEAQFRESGIRRGLFEGTIVRGSLLEWRIDITPGFPSTTMRAVAKIRLEIMPSAESPTSATPVYSARYSGIVEEKHPIGSTERIQRAFARALAEAAAEALQDERFVKEMQGRSTGSAPQFPQR